MVRGSTGLRPLLVLLLSSLQHVDQVLGALFAPWQLQAVPQLFLLVGYFLCQKPNKMEAFWPRFNECRNVFYINSGLKEEKGDTS